MTFFLLGIMVDVIKEKLVMSEVSLAERYLIVAVDEADLDRALEIVENLKDKVAAVKLGLEFFVANGADGVRQIVELGCPVFLDLKFHDIPNTVLKAVREAKKLGVKMMTVHSSGGREMMEKVAEEVEGDVLTLGVSVLTSMDKKGMNEIGVNGEVF